jgi:hypothetical protein
MPHLTGAFGEDSFGRHAEAAARFFGTPRYIFGQTIIVVVWIAVNVIAVGLRWDPYPFILLNLVFSTQAAYAAPLTRSPRPGRSSGTRSPSIGWRTTAKRCPCTCRSGRLR